MARVFLTGGAGFIDAVARQLLAGGHEVAITIHSRIMSIR